MVLDFLSVALLYNKSNQDNINNKKYKIMNHLLLPAAVMAVKMLDQSMRNELPYEIVDTIQTHAGIAVAAAWIPIGGLDVAALTANVWTMYARINKKLGISFSENMMKSIGSAVAANLASNLAIAGVGAALKWIPVIGTVTGGIIMSASMYGTTIGAAWIYLTALVNWVKKGQGSGDDLRSCINDVMAQNKDTINNVINKAKASYKK